MTLSTILHAYSFDTRTPEGLASWQAFKAERKASGAPLFGPVYHDGREDLAHDGATIELDPGADNINLFQDQWNATAAGGLGFRAFDWILHAERSHPSQIVGAPAGIKRGYWLEQTEEMRRLRADTLTCGYCGHKHPIADAPVADGRGKAARPDLSEAEQAERMALWQDAQREGAKTRAGAKLAKFRQNVEAKHSKVIESAGRERNGLLWLLDHDLGGIACDNTIYYSHTGRFSIGWRQKLDGAVAHEIMGKLSDLGFPFPYDVETVNLGKLSGCVED